jgi:hypothetical protein
MTHQLRLVVYAKLHALQAVEMPLIAIYAKTSNAAHVVHSHQVLVVIVKLMLLMLVQTVNVTLFIYGMMKMKSVLCVMQGVQTV